MSGLHIREVLLWRAECDDGWVQLAALGSRELAESEGHLHYLHAHREHHGQDRIACGIYDAPAILGGTDATGVPMLYRVGDRIEVRVTGLHEPRWMPATVEGFQGPYLLTVGGGQWFIREVKHARRPVPGAQRAAAARSRPSRPVAPEGS